MSEGEGGTLSNENVGGETGERGGVVEETEEGEESGEESF